MCACAHCVQVMAIVGFEVDQVIRGGNPDGSDMSVPINAAYNHHFDGTLNNGKKSTLVKLGPNDPRLQILEARSGHKVGTSPYIAVEHTAGVGGAPTSIQLGGGNGGEYRKTFHGSAPGFVQIIESPTEMQITPMQIDTWNRDKMNLTGNSPFVSGPVPRNSLAPTVGVDALYSGLLECPLTTRITKNIESNYDLLGSGRCDDKGLIATAAECFSAAAKALGLRDSAGVLLTKIVNEANTAAPTGCSITALSAGKFEVVFNLGKDSAAQCGRHAAVKLGSAASFVNTTVELNFSASRATPAVATITLRGPAKNWFGVGFGADSMKNTYAIIVDGGTGAVSERVLGDHVEGQLLSPPSVTVVSSAVKKGVRTIVLQRAAKGATAAHYTFAGNDTAISLIDAIGSTPALSYHLEKTASTIFMLPVGGANVSGACICAHEPLPFGQGKGTLIYTPVAGDKGERGTKTELGYSNRCAPAPRGDLFWQKNPMCDVRTFTGGQTACHHMWSLLDADQPIPWPEQPINYTMKWRFHYQEYDPKVHTTIQYSHLGAGTDWSIGAGSVGAGIGSEYDVPKCAPGVPGCNKEADGTWVHTITGTFKVGNGKQFAPTAYKIYPVVAHLHCHAPTCLSMAIYNNATGDLMCEEVATYGNDTLAAGAHFGEPGYIAVPPCVWGRPEDGLEEPYDISNITLRVVKRANGTYGHHGEMAHGEIYYIDQPRG